MVCKFGNSLTHCTVILCGPGQYGGLTCSEASVRDLVDLLPDAPKVEAALDSLVGVADFLGSLSSFEIYGLVNKIK